MCGLVSIALHGGDRRYIASQTNKKKEKEEEKRIQKIIRYHVFDVFWWGTLGNALHQLLVYPLDTCRRRMQVSRSLLFLCVSVSHSLWMRIPFHITPRLRVRLTPAADEE